jgi:hypothetical protein
MTETATSCSKPLIESSTSQCLETVVNDALQADRGVANHARTVVEGCEVDDVSLAVLHENSHCSRVVLHDKGSSGI